jgi:hypothetical protein
MQRKSNRTRCVRIRAMVKHLCALGLLLSLSVRAETVDFSKDVYPILQRACFECHGAESQKGNLRLDTKGEASSHSKAISPGKPEESELIRRISLPREHKDAMPKRGNLLLAAEIQNIKNWIAAGAVWPDDLRQKKHWSYLPPVRPLSPPVKRTAWIATEIDSFILSRLEQENIEPSPEAAPEIIFRRLALDLTGLPPSLEDSENFVSAYQADPSYALDKWAEHFLSSPEFGVKWARHWLDLARYADSHGFQRDDLRDVWAYRDWVVNALNDGMPFDQFTIEQIGGDLLPSATQDQIIATGFHRCTPTNVEAGTEPEESRINQVIDRVNTTGAVWMGVTLECAQCHNHKYDAFSQRDYYGLLAYFNNTEKEAERTNPKVPGSIRFNGSPFKLLDPSLDGQRATIKKAIRETESKIDATSKSTPQSTATGKANLAVLTPTTFITESGADFDQLDDGSLLLTGTAPEEDTYTFEAEIPKGTFTGIKLEALTHPTLPGEGPGRGTADRPNFVLQGFECSQTSSNSPSNPSVPFDLAVASFSQKGFEASNLITGEGSKSWAINPRFHESHWVVFRFAHPLEGEPRGKITIKMPQHYGGSRVMGRIRLSLISGDLDTAIPNAPQTKKADPQQTKLALELKNLNKKLSDLTETTTEVMRELETPRMTRIFKRGEYTQPSDPVTAATPAIVGFKAKESGNRLDLARWLVSPENPLTARVTVNRWWAEIFGRGIVSTVEDFGIKGEPPTHPELLDWLATEFMENGWSLKHVLKKIVTSATYRQSSSFIHPAATTDPANTLLWRGPRFRMDAEMIRDNALSIAGLLSLGKGGPPIRPPQPDGLWKKVGGAQYDYTVTPGEGKFRRGLYVVLKRGSPNPSFMNFDASARMACVVKRSRSNTPLQALTLLNDPVYVEATAAFANRIASSPFKSEEEKISNAFRLALSRTPTQSEITLLHSLFTEQLHSSAQQSEAWYAIAAAILNLDECITKG